jgi:Probable Zinc-ribbon domain
MCARRRVTPETSLLTCHPEIARQWHPTKNGDLGPGDVSRGSDEKVWWQCRKDPGHAWQATVYSRTHAGSGCSACAGRVVTPATSLAGRFPAIAAEWHPTKNEDLTPAGIMPGSMKRSGGAAVAIPPTRG